MRHFRHDKRGWVIYRTAYGDDEAWERFKQNVIERSRRRLAKPGVPPELADALEWTFVSDRATLEGASVDQPRHRFRDWAIRARKTEQPRAPADVDRDWNGERSPRYSFFIQVDEEGLHTAAYADLSDPFDSGWVNLVRADEDIDSSRNSAGLIDETEHGEEDEDEGWMMIAAYMIGPDFYDAIDQWPDTWYAFYTPPPGLVVY
ncbi:hypothetical protein AJ79_00449 [Helicocarpus griseus UAMH5409]|uniref:Uncharacterized protein n=1 Tax=Helicocarpus griseus UAMH5409 TaxID=1447875 RepID=A0A2B7YBZ0_9EURO|nr:hypothetical protein AJ79_00449 [Helicocarpus griseus UAMH5409]